MALTVQSGSGWRLAVIQSDLRRCFTTALLMNAGGPSKEIFDHEKLDVYDLELKFLVWVTPLLLELRRKAQGFHREVCDQLDRASLSALLNTAEGNGKRWGRQRAKFFDDARGSAVECAACLDALVAKQLVSTAAIREGKELLFRIVSMLTRLIIRFEQDGADSPPKRA